MAMEMSREQKKEVNDYEEMRNKRIQQNMQRMVSIDDTVFIKHSSFLYECTSG